MNKSRNKEVVRSDAMPPDGGHEGAATSSKQRTRDKRGETRTLTKRNPVWAFGICTKAHSINKVHKNGKPYYYPVTK